jgi:hypothetical protein
MRQERIRRKVPRRPRTVEILPLDPRDPDVVRAKAMLVRRTLGTRSLKA